MILLFVNSCIISQSDIIPGLPFITNYPFEEYIASPQNWDVVQADDGIMYFANGNGILEFDAARWRLIEMPNKSIVRSLYISNNGVIYVGGYEDFGYLHPNENGTLEYISLLNKLPDNANYFQDVWTTISINDKVFFQTYYSIFIYEADSIREIKSDSEFIWGFKVNDTYYIHEAHKDLLIFKDETFQKIKGSKRFYNENIFSILSYPYNQTLIITDQGNIFICYIDTNLLQLEIIDSLTNIARDYLQQNYFYSGINYMEDKICLGTFYDGFLMIDKLGNPLMHINRSYGINDNNIRNIFKDKSDNLWLATDRGIAYVNMNHSLTIFNEYLNISGSVNSAIIFDNPSDNIPKRLYVATMNGIYYKNLERNTEAPVLSKFQKFSLYSNLRTEVWDFFCYKNTLLCATSNGVYEIKNNTVNAISYNISWSFTSIKNKPDLLLVNREDGLDLLEINNVEWKYKWKLKGFYEFAGESVFDEDNNLWIECVSGGIYKMKLSESYDSVVSKKLYDISNGLPSNDLNNAYNFDKNLKFTTEKGIYIFNKENDRFFPDTSLNKLIGEIPLDYIFKDPNKNIWYFSTFSKSLGELIYQENGTYKRNTPWFNEVKNFSIWNMYYYNDSNVFFSSPHGLLLYNNSKRRKEIPKYETLIRKVEIINNADSIFLLNPNNENINDNILPYKQNAIKFSYAIPYYGSINNNQFCYFLEGFDPKSSGWSPWAPQSEKEYNYLKEGEYTFYVKSRSVLMTEGNIASFSFKIKPPFYRTLIAYFAYIIFLIFFIYGIIKYYTQRLKFANIKLERKIETRTYEIRKHNQELYEHKEYILKQRNDLHVLNANKDKFFSIIAHDLKNPFNTILGFSELLMENLENDKSGDDYTYAEIISKTANSTYELLENLLTWSNIQGNNIKSKPKKLLVTTILKDCLVNLNQIAEIKNITLQNKITDDSLSVYADPNMLHTILRNLITNAIKFSYPGKNVIINAKDSGNDVVISVKDKGVGISEKNIKRLFKVEENISTEGTKKEMGSGLGLILCHGFVKMNKGTIWVISNKDKGSTFFISLPKNKVS